MDTADGQSDNSHNSGDTSASSAAPLMPAEVALLEAPLILCDGAVVRVRPIRPDDTERLRAFHAHLSFESVVFRFFRALPELPRDMAEHFTHVDYDNRMALVATRGEGAQQELLAVVRYERTAPHAAEIAFVVQDEWQSHGIATALLHRLAAYARDHAITTFIAITMGSNVRMLDVLHQCGFPYHSHFDDGQIVAELDISAPPVFPAQSAPAVGDRRTPIS
jgi:RimJ/RimL family protein N-acetyltransferase